MAFAPTRRTSTVKSLNTSRDAFSFTGSKFGSIAEPLNTEQEKDLMLLREQITLSRIAWNKRKYLAETAKELTREMATIKRTDQDTSRILHQELIFHNKRDLAQSFRFSNHDAMAKAKDKLANESVLKEQQVRECREERETMIRQALSDKTALTKRISETVKTEMLTNELQIEQVRLSTASRKTAKTRELRERRERSREALRRNNFAKLATQRWEYECDRQDQFAKNIEDTLQVIKHIHLEKTKLDDTRKQQWTRLSQSARRESSCDSFATTSARSSTFSYVSAKTREAPVHDTARPQKSTYPAHGSSRQPPARATAPDSAPLASKGSRQRSLSADQIPAGSRLFASTLSSSAKATPRSDPAGRFRNRYGNWEQSQELSADSTDQSEIYSPRETIIFTPHTPRSRTLCSTPRTPCMERNPELRSPETPLVQCHAGTLRADDSGFELLTAPGSLPMLKIDSEDSVAGPLSDTPTVESPTEEFLPGEVIFMPAQTKKISPQCFVATDTSECLFYETPSLQADAAGQIRQVPLTPVVE